MSGGRLRAIFGASVLTIGCAVDARADEPKDVLIEVRFRDLLTPKGAPPPPPWAESDPDGVLPRVGFVVPDVDVPPGGGPRLVVYQKALYPANERDLRVLRDVDFCLLQGPRLEPLFENRRSCVARIHSNPRLVHEARGPATCRKPVCGGNSHGLRKHLEADAAAAYGGGTGVLIVVVDVPLNAAHIKRWQGVGFDPDYSHAHDGGEPGKGPIKSHGTMAAYLATVLAPKATLASISTPAFKDNRLEGAIAGLTKVVDKFTTTPEGDRYRGVVVNNSWAVAEERYVSSKAEACGAPGRATREVFVSASSCHVFNTLLRDLSGDPLRFDFVFAAGNRGQCEPIGNEGSIRGPARLAEVTTVAAVDATRRRLFDSGHGALNTTKPDVSAYTHYTASGTIKMDTQTSGATAVTSGLVAAVRSCLRHKASTAEVRRIVAGEVNRDVRRSSSTSTAQPTTLLTHDREFGSGVILPVQALSRVCRPPTP
jgi:hypothetical protein